MGNYYQENGRLQESQDVHAQVHKGQYYPSYLQTKRTPSNPRKVMISFTRWKNNYCMNELET